MRRLTSIISGVTITAGLVYYNRDSIRRSSFYATLLSTPVIRLLPPEDAHKASVKLLASGLGPIASGKDPEELRTKLGSITLSNPIGLAAGFDKHAEAMDACLDMGFGYMEVGSITPLPQPGNPGPRVFRLTSDQGVINRYGFNSEGAAVAAGRFAAYRDRHGFSDRIVGINVGKNKEGDALQDYSLGVKIFAPFADYLVVNISSPNTPGLRNLQARQQLQDLMVAVKQSRDKLPWNSAGEDVQAPTMLSAAAAHSWKNLLARNPPPIFVKIAPDLTQEELEDIVAVVKAVGIDGLVVSNTTVSRPASLTDTHRNETGGLSGKPLRQLSTDMIRRTYALTNGTIPIIGVGGISTAADVLEKVEAGANACQLYSGLVYGGPSMIPKMKVELAELLKAKGYASVNNAVGAAHRRLQ